MKILAIYMDIAPWQGQTTPGGKFLFFFFFKKCNSVNLVIFCKFFPFNYFATVFPIQAPDGSGELKQNSLAFEDRQLMKKKICIHVSSCQINKIYW